MVLKSVPAFLIIIVFFFFGGGVLRENSPLRLPPFWGLGSEGFFWALLMVLCHKQNSAGETPLVRRVA
jgi:hypothetical protein